MNATPGGALCEGGYGHAKHWKLPDADPEIPNGQRQRTANRFAADQTAICLKEKKEINKKLSINHKPKLRSRKQRQMKRQKHSCQRTAKLTK
jgi:hypothetical protein